MTLAGLLERLEAATGPDREIDAALWLAFTPGATRRTVHINHWKSRYDIDEACDETGRLIVVPEYTASIDAIVALIKRTTLGWTWKASNDNGAGRSEFYLFDPLGRHLISGLATPDAVSLAACIALIRAKISEEKNG